MDEAGSGAERQARAGRDPVGRAISVGCTGLLGGVILLGAILIVLQVIQGEINDRLLDRTMRLGLAAGALALPFVAARFARRATGTGMNFRDLQPPDGDDGYGMGARASYLGEPIAASPAWLMHGFSFFQGYTAGALYLGERLLFVAADGEVILDVSREEARGLKFRPGRFVLKSGNRTSRITFLPPDSTSGVLAGFRCHWRWKRLLREWARGEQPEVG